jgi:hypothetical protein
MKKLLLALGAASMALSATPAVAQHHDRGHHYGERHDAHRYSDRHRSGIRIYVGVRPTYTDRYRYGYRPYATTYDYSGPVFQVGSVYQCYKPYGGMGILRDRYGRVINAYRGLYNYPAPYRCR